MNQNKYLILYTNIFKNTRKNGKFWIKIIISKKVGNNN